MLMIQLLSFQSFVVTAHMALDLSAISLAYVW